MADKDVKLIIRAKNEASRAIDAVSEALAELNKNQQTVGDSAGKTDSLLGSLGDEFQRLSREANGLGALNKVASQLDKVNAAIGRMEGEAQKSADNLSKFQAEAQKAADSTKNLQGQVGGLEKALNDQKKATDTARDARTKANRELRKAETAYANLQKQIAKQKAPGSASKSADAFFAADVNKARQAASDAASAYDAQRAKQDAARQSLNELNSAIVQSQNNEDRLAKEIQAATAATERNAKALQSAKTQLAEIQTIGKTAASVLGNVAVKTDDLDAASKRVADDLARVTAQYEAMQRFSDGAGGFTDPKSAANIRAQRAEVDKARQAWELLDAIHRKEAAAAASVAAPTREMTEAVRQSAAAARAAKQEYQKQIDVLNKMPGAMSKVNGIRGIFGAFYGESRQAMSVLQRLRGEVLSLTTAYVGFYGAINNIGGVIKSYQSLEAAQNRLGAAFNQDQSRTDSELSWLQRQADRLGISFATLSDEYSKFAVAAQAANFSGEATRKVFLSVAEAGRVNKLSVEQLQGVFLALQQMISKGKVQSEELRRQLGDRLPGAFNIMADALGVTTAELDKMMKAGEVIANESTLIKFADQLDKRFGGQLATSLRSTTTLIGRFGNELYNAQLRVARGGFIDALNEGLAELNRWFGSREGRDFFLSLGAAAGKVVSVLAQIPKYFGLIATGIKLVIALRFTQWIREVSDRFGLMKAATAEMVRSLNLAKSETVSFAAVKATLTARINAVIAAMRGYTASLTTSVRGLTLARAGTLAWTGALVTLRTVATTVGAVVRGLFTALGGWVGIAVTAISFIATNLIADWAGGVDKVTEALDEHQRLMQEVLKAYDEAKDKTDDWAKSIKNVTVDEINANIRKLRNELDDLKNSADVLGEVNPARAWFEGWSDVAGQINDTKQAFRDGKINATEYREALENIYNNTTNDKAQKFIEGQLKAARKVEDVSRALGQEASAALKMGSTLGGLQDDVDATGASIEDLTEAAKDSGEAFDNAAERMKNYNDAIDKIRGKIPALAIELKKQKELAEIEENYQKALANASSPGQATQAYNDRQAARKVVLDDADKAYFKEIAGNTKVSKDLFDYIHGKEDYRSNAYDDGYGNMTIGFGSTIVNGRKVQAGDTISKDDAIRQATQDIAKIVSQIEALVKVPLSDSQMKALVSYAYNAGIGSLKRDGILAPLNKGDYAGAEDAIRHGVDTSGGVYSPGLRARREQEADTFHQGNDDPEILKEKLKLEQERTEELNKQREATKGTIADNDFAIKQQQLIADGKGREAAIEEAIRKAKEQNKNITQEEIDKITEQTGKLYDMQHAQDAVKQAEAEVNRLLQTRQELMQQIEYFQGQGQFAQADALQSQLEGVNSQLSTAIDKAIAMWRAIGGPDADLAIAKLNTTKLGLADLGNQSQISGKQINDMLTNGLVDAFDEFAQAVANGENAVDAMWRAFRKFAAEFLINIAKMILQQAIFNLLSGGIGGGAGGVGGWIAGLLRHDGGEVTGSSGLTRAVSPMIFANAVRYHEGVGSVGLKPGEVPAILKEGEVVDPGDGSIFAKTFGQGGKSPNIKIVNAFDSAQVVSEGLASPVGEQVFMNMVRNNASSIKTALGT